MSSFLYYKNILMAANMVMLNEVGSIQMERYAAAGFSGEQAEALIQAIPYEENNPYNRAFSYSLFLLSAILLVIVQQTLFYGMSMLVGTAREENRSFASLPDKLEGHGVGRVVLGARRRLLADLHRNIHLHSMYNPCIVRHPAEG